ncbi:MAG: F-type H+-transporting ATPase subunit delta [Chloroflexi bacterium]|jgi:F-type H+-transporting ATPase subunit delta|nr:MAG: F-type H+-transporting ATPase subunit delta [Chloroflexota bacterium]
MPGNEVAAKRYAEAAFAIAKAEGLEAAWALALDGLASLVADPTVGAYLQTAKVAESAKFATLDQALAGSDAKARSLAKLLVRKRRIGLAGEVATAFGAMVNADRGVASARVTTATALSDEGRASVTRAVRASTGATDVQLDEQIDREILGGAIVQVGDHIIDGSVRTRLRGLRRSIAGSIG